MALKFSLKTARIEFSDDDHIEVRGLTLPDITQLVDAHKDTATELFDKFTGRDEKSFTLEDGATLAAGIATVFPAISAHVIALAAEVTEQYDQVLKLPLDVQIASLEKIVELTFAMQGGAKNSVETVLRIAQGANGLKDKLTTPRLT